MRRATDRPPPRRRAIRFGVRIAILWALIDSPRATAQPIAPGRPALATRGRRFVDPNGRVIVLRGVNLAGNSKLPPFDPVPDPRALDPLPGLGFNVVRLVLSWEAIEPRLGAYDPSYLNRMTRLAAECAARGLYVILDVHQDGYSRFLSGGSGDGFPPWAISPRARLVEPDNGPGCRDWPIRMALDPGMHRSFSEFYADANGVRTRYLLMLSTLARAFADVPGVIGYDPLNEPWGRERAELAPLYADAARAIRAHDPTAILFLEGHVTTNFGLQTRLPVPDLGNVAYAPHYYKPSVVLAGSWRGGTATIDTAFRHMRATSEAWDAPLFLAEFGAPAEAHRGGEYVDALYDRLDASLASGAQWNYTPGWDERAKDGWNGEDFNILDPSGRLRANFRPRPHPRAVAGEAVAFGVDARGLRLSWDARPERGATEVFLPNPGAGRVAVSPPEVGWGYDPIRRVLSVHPTHEGRVSLRVESR